MKIFYVYIHRRGDTNEPYYVGKGRDGRAYDFINRNDFWKRIHRKHGTIVEIYRDQLLESEAFEIEVTLIATLKGDLCNQSPGGSGGDLSKFIDYKSRSVNVKACSLGGKIGGSKGGKRTSQTHKRNLTGVYDRDHQVKAGRAGGLANKGVMRKFKTVTCPHCGIKGKESAMYRWHFERCKNR